MSTPTALRAQAAPTLAERQQALRLRSAELRRELALDLQPLQRPLLLAGRVQAAWQWLRARPEVVLAVLAGVAIVRPRRAWRLSLNLFWAWRQWRRVQRWLQGGPSFPGAP
ncbi:MAG TPA: YqjK family protein [Rubrivivax sp.]|nr:YqjK family protein [Rubrivivax sp.]